MLMLLIRWEQVVIRHFKHIALTYSTSTAYVGKADKGIYCALQPQL